MVVYTMREMNEADNNCLCFYMAAIGTIWRLFLFVFCAVAVVVGSYARCGPGDREQLPGIGVVLLQSSIALPFILSRNGQIVNTKIYLFACVRACVCVFAEMNEVEIVFGIGRSCNIALIGFCP